MALNPATLVHELMDLLADGLKPFCKAQLEEHFGQKWALNLGVRKVHVQVARDGQVKWDTHALLKAMSNFPEVFSKSLEEEARGYVEELRKARNKSAHQGSITLDHAERWWDTGRRLFRELGLTTHAARAADVLAKIRAVDEAEAHVDPRASVQVKAVNRLSDAKGHVTLRAIAPKNAWSVLRDEEVTSKALAEFGSVSLNPFYSNPSRTLRQGAVYIVSLNPGGDPSTIPSQREGMPLDHPQRASSRDDWSKLLDESWGTNYQASVRHLARSVLPGGERGLREAFCTNALFMRGPIKSGVDARGLWEVCRPWHLAWLEVVRPSAILCLGNGEGASPYAWFRGLLDTTKPLPSEAAYNNFAVKACTGKLDFRPVTVVGTPHPAHWSASAPKSVRAVEYVRRLLEHCWKELA